MIKKSTFLRKKFFIPFVLGFLISFSLLYIQDSIHLIFKNYGILDFNFSIFKKKITFFSLELPHIYIDYITVYFDFERPNKVKVRKIEIYGAKIFSYESFSKETLQKLINKIKKYIKNKFNSNVKDYNFTTPFEISFEPKIFIYNSKIIFSDVKLCLHELKIDSIKEIKGYGDFNFLFKKYKLNLKGNIKFNWKSKILNLNAVLFKEDFKIGYVKASLKDNKFILKAYAPQLDHKILKSFLGNNIESLVKRYKIATLIFKNNYLNIFVDNIYAFPLKYKINLSSLLSFNSENIKVRNENIKLFLGSENNVLKFSGDNLSVFKRNIYKHFGKISTKDFNIFNYKLKILPKKDLYKSISLNGSYFARGNFAKLKIFIKDEKLLIPIFQKIKNYKIKFKDLVINSQITIFPFESLEEIHLKSFSYKNYTFNNITLKGFFKNKIFQGYAFIKNPNIYVKKVILDLKKYYLEFLGIVNDNFKKIESFLKNIKIKLPFEFLGKINGSFLGKYNIKDQKLFLSFETSSRDAILNLNISNFTFPLKFIKTWGSIVYDKKLKKKKIYITGFSQGKNFSLFKTKFPITFINPFASFIYTYPQKKFLLNLNYFAVFHKLDTYFLGTLNLTYANNLVLYIEDINKNLLVKIKQENKKFYINGKVRKFNYKDFILKNSEFFGEIYPNLNLYGKIKYATYKPYKNLLFSNINFEYFPDFLKIKKTKIRYKSFLSIGNFTYNILNKSLYGNIYGNISLHTISKYYKLKFLSNFNTKYNLTLSYNINDYNLRGNLYIMPFTFTLNTSKIKSIGSYYKDVLKIKVKPIYAYFDIDTFKKPYILNDFKLNLSASITSQNNIFKKANLEIKDRKLILNVNRVNYNSQNLKTNFDLFLLLKNYISYFKFFKNDVRKFINSKVFNKNYQGEVYISLNNMEYGISTTSKKSFINLKDIKKFLKKYRLTLNIKSKNLIKIKGKDFEILGKLEVSLPDSHLAYIKDLSGNFNLLDYKFIILHGIIKIDLKTYKGHINLIASTKKDDFTIFCLVNGDLENPNVLFISYPYLPQNEILTLLLGVKNIAEDYVEYQTKYFSIKPKFTETSVFESYMISLYIPITPNLIFEYSRLLNGNELSYDIKYKITRDIYILSSMKKEQDINVMELGIGIEKNIW